MCREECLNLTIAQFSSSEYLFDKVTRILPKTMGSLHQEVKHDMCLLYKAHLTEI